MMHTTNLLLVLRRFRRSLFLRRQREILCACCSASIERHEFVCENDECQIWALTGQAMIATSQPAQKVAPRRIAHPRARIASEAMGGIHGAAFPSS
jgi:hypothetical protein